MCGLGTKEDIVDSHLCGAPQRDLKGSPLVSSFRYGHLRETGLGIPVCECFVQPWMHVTVSHLKARSPWVDLYFYTPGILQNLARTSHHGVL